MHKDVQVSHLNAFTCETLPAPALSVTRADGDPGEPVPAPLADRVSCPISNVELREHIATTLQLVAASQALIHPWLSLRGLYRLIVTPDRSAAVTANKALIESIGQTVAMHQGEQSAFAFPCQRGIVVIMPLDIVRYALAPDSEIERQYGLTTIWHELAHVHALHLHFFSDGSFDPQRQLNVPGWIYQAWHEFFADRHSHWPGFSTELERRLVTAAAKEFHAAPTLARLNHFLVRLSSAYGRILTEPTGASQFAQLLQSISLPPEIWSQCADALDRAAEWVRETGRQPELGPIEGALSSLSDSLRMSWQSKNCDQREPPKGWGCSTGTGGILRTKQIPGFQP
jgi:hypothetical protein